MWSNYVHRFVIGLMGAAMTYDAYERGSKVLMVFWGSILIGHIYYTVQEIRLVKKTLTGNQVPVSSGEQNNGA